MGDFGGPPLFASELIEELERLIDEHGDVLVTIAGNDAHVREVVAYDSDGGSKGKPVEFALHGW